MKIKRKGAINMAELEWGSDEWKDKYRMEIEEDNWRKLGYEWDEDEEEYIKKVREDWD